MVGNDIVDLNLAKIQSNWQRKGFLEKLFTDAEQNEIVNSENPFLQVWLFWSMKEAAYKCYTQEWQRRFFGPKKFVCETITKSEGVVEFDHQKYSVNYQISDNYVHSIAFKKESKEMVSELFLIDKNDCKTKITNQNLLAYFGFKTELYKNEFGIPYLYQNNQKLPVSISTSHHGNYGGFAFTLKNE
ncbi:MULTISPECIES: 4'-phosphopantetheinyl transferase superfamily protein [unclassified Polaribacter]|uniref:4'-phosphopantetheinyl transferase family protein n=1 Tax=unclassified Polaribacter TaxID=196858 RepID=UPI0011BF3714|nr:MULTISPECIES: 4'-phosphopantetheinyl transferase superfamily protein [unclassified Polaribacter]TXD52817.1 4-phosphopantetheinyl transferase family protein [Polaribacter sp. IC063]TXD61694.1 4-phosphopantetheinyl transferase family protein [Polaribacter sp. IC066]